MTQDNVGADMIEKDIVRTQNDISETVSELQEKLQPQQLLRTVVGDPQQVPSQLFDAVKRNPAAALLIGIGAVWLLSGHQPKMPKLGRNGKNGQDFVDQQFASIPRYEGESEEIYQARLATARDNHAASSDEGVRGKIGGFTQGLRDKAKQLGGGSLTLGEAKSAIATRGRSAAAWSSAKHDQEPLVTAVGAVAIGALAALAIPKTKVEREKFAPLRETAMSKVAGIKEQALQAAGEKLSGESHRQSAN